MRLASLLVIKMWPFVHKMLKTTALDTSVFEIEFSTVVIQEYFLLVLC
jgi:hypothetical protein